MYQYMGRVLPTLTSLRLYLILKDLIKSRQLIITHSTHFEGEPRKGHREKVSTGLSINTGK
jgi:hypothetical protein